jgi:hypothetical protein
MKRLFLSLLLIIYMQYAHAQNNKWFKGIWYGSKSFTSAHIGIQVPVRIEIDSVDDIHFFGRFIYMYPADTTSRLIKTFSGNLKNASISINKSREIFLRDPRTRSFWSDCSACNETARFTSNDSTFFLTITTAHCGDSCNGETIVTRGINQYNIETSTQIKKLITQTNAPSITPTNTNKKTKKATQKNTAVATNNLNDTIHANTSLSITATANKQLENKKANPINLHAVDSTTSKISEPVNNASTQSTTNKASNFTDTIAHVSSNDVSIQTMNKKIPDTAMQERIHRKTDFVNTLQVIEPHIKVELFDNGEIDSDAVSVYYNGSLIINNRTLTTKAITFYVDASAANRHLELTLIAENEGSIPPNSALMRITAGDKHFELFISTNLTKNAKIALDYIGN